jgi:hypothetical protein
MQPHIHNVLFVYAILLSIFISTFDANLFKSNHSHLFDLISTNNKNTNTSYLRKVSLTTNGDERGLLNDRFRILFKSSLAKSSSFNNNQTLVRCLLNTLDGKFVCESPQSLKSIYCKLDFSFSELMKLNRTSENLRMYATSLIKKKSHLLDVLKFRLFPFRILDTETNFASNLLVFDYYLLTQGTWNVLSVYYDKIADVFQLSFGDTSCLSQLINLLNEMSISTK